MAQRDERTSTRNSRYYSRYSLGDTKSYDYIYTAAVPEREPKTEPGRHSRTRVRPRAPQTGRHEASQTVIQVSPKQAITVKELRQLITVAIFISVILIGVLILNAQATNIQCSINSMTKSNLALEDEIDGLNMQLDTGTSIEEIESYALNELGMQYPENNQCIYLDSSDELMDNFTLILKQKAYGVTPASN